MRLTATPGSGNAQKIVTLRRRLGRDCTVIEPDTAARTLADAKAEGALPSGKLPVLALGDGRAIPEFNAILCYLRDLFTAAVSGSGFALPPQVQPWLHRVAAP